ncbi:MobC family plasmid mobilization relaxosome protein [Rhodospirillum sp. A1_3_36]|uniref:MobC family plasmid mobilization relaxosome protein n=1 Tax=Rhodospirillum sp. A1_3_36 TaxID=3391666 RepID=UPI0039A6CE33
MSEDDGPPSDTRSADRAENMRRYRKDYWERFRQTRRRVYGTLTAEEHARAEQRAKDAGRSVWAQIHAEAEAYARGEYLPSKNVEEGIGDLIVQLRRIGNNINQIARAVQGTGEFDGDILLDRLAELEDHIRAFTEKPWGRPTDDDAEP